MARRCLRRRCRRLLAVGQDASWPDAGLGLVVIPPATVRQGGAGGSTLVSCPSGGAGITGTGAASTLRRWPPTVTLAAVPARRRLILSVGRRIHEGAHPAAGSRCRWPHWFPPGQPGWAAHRSPGTTVTTHRAGRRGDGHAGRLPEPDAGSAVRLHCGQGWSGLVSPGLHRADDELHARTERSPIVPTVGWSDGEAVRRQSRPTKEHDP
jgi:hypothetical protein